MNVGAYRTKEEKQKKEAVTGLELISNRGYSVVKDNKLIQNVTRRKYELSVLEQKVLCFILSKIKPAEDITSEPEYTYQFNIRDFCRVCGIDYDNGKNYKNVKAALDKLADNSFWLDYGEGEFRFQWIVTPDIRKGQGVIEVEIPKKVMPYLWKLSEKFTAYQLYNILALKSSYSIMLYELFKSYAWKKTIVLSLDDLRKYLGLDETKYKEYKALRRAVIERSLKEIETYTDLRVTFEPVRRGRYYVALEFNIRVTEGTENWESYRRAMAEINGVRYIPGQMHLFE